MSIRRNLVTDEDVSKKKRLRVRPFFRWFDLWIGVYVDPLTGAVYFCPIPTIGLKFWHEEVLLCPECSRPVEKAAYWTGDAWHLCGNCINQQCINCDTLEAIDEIEWPFGDRYMTGKELEACGYAIW